MHDLAQNTASELKEHEAAQDARPDNVIAVNDAGLLVPVFALTASPGLLNGDRDAAADLCEVTAAVGLALRSSPFTVSTALLELGVSCADHVIEQLGTGAWTTDPAHPTTEEQDVWLAANLRADLDAIKSWLGQPSLGNSERLGRAHLRSVSRQDDEESDKLGEKSRVV